MRPALRQQVPRRDEAVDSLRPKLGLERPDVAVERLHIERGGLALYRRQNPRVARGAQHADHRPLAFAPDADRRMALFLREPVHDGKDLLHLISQDVTAHFVGHAVNELSMWLV